MNNFSLPCGVSTLGFSDQLSERTVWVSALPLVKRVEGFAEISSLMGAARIIVQVAQLKSGPLTKPWIFHVRCYWQLFCWNDIILLHVQELARLLQVRGEPVLAVRISWISLQWVLVFERHFLRFHNAVNGERTCVYFGKLFRNDVLRPL
jgi:hypothetical protein